MLEAPDRHRLRSQRRGRVEPASPARGRWLRHRAGVDRRRRIFAGEAIRGVDPPISRASLAKAGRPSSQPLILDRARGPLRSGGHRHADLSVPVQGEQVPVPLASTRTGHVPTRAQTTWRPFPQPFERRQSVGAASVADGLPLSACVKEAEVEVHVAEATRSAVAGPGPPGGGHQTSATMGPEGPTAAARGRGPGAAGRLRTAATSAAALARLAEPAAQKSSPTSRRTQEARRARWRAASVSTQGKAADFGLPAIVWADSGGPRLTRREKAHEPFLCRYNRRDSHPRPGRLTIPRREFSGR
jgi:hypothetical protein